MKVLSFTIPVADDRAVMVQEDVMPHFYPHLHRHKEAQLIWIKKGEGTLFIDNRMYAFKGGDVFLIGANQPHLFKSNSEYFEENHALHIEALMIFFDPAGKLQSFLALPEMQLVRTYLQASKGGLKLPSQATAGLSTNMIRLQNARHQEVMICFLQLLDELYRWQTESVPLAANAPALFSETEGLRIGHIYHFLMQHYHRSISLEEVAAIAHMTPQAFCRYFKKHTRQTLVAFLNEIRVNEVCRILAEGRHESISVVAYRCGFNSMTNFNRIFKAIMKMPPKTYVEHYHKI